MPNLCQSFVALNYNINSSKMRDLESGVVICIRLSRSHFTFISERASSVWAVARFRNVVINSSKFPYITSNSLVI